jgi:anti-anti-sigma factor
MDDVHRLKISGRYDNIPLITEFVGEAARAAGLDEDAVFHCQMAVDEACTNVIEHAYGGNGKGDIEITCHVSPGKCVISILDTGLPFDPVSIPDRKPTADVDQIEPGGVGLHLMRKLMDEVTFHFSDQGTTLVMVKTGKPTTPPPKALTMPAHKAAGDIWVVRPEGRVDADQAPTLERTLTQILDEGHCRIVVDMSRVTYIASRGLKSLVAAWRRADKAGGKLALSGMSPRLLSVFDMTGFTELFSIHPTMDAALNALGPTLPK